MTLVFINWGHYPGFRPVLDCAKARAGCRIIVISDGPKSNGVEHIPISRFPVGQKMREVFEPHIGQWASFSMARWYVLRDLAQKEPEIFPIFCADWDVMVFRNLADAYAPFKDNDYNVSIDDGMEGIAYGVNRMAPLEAFCNLAEQHAREGGEQAARLNDMEAWSRNTRTLKWKVGDLFQIKNNFVFDHNIHCGKDRFIFNGDAKLLEFHQGNPYFVLKSDESRIAAATIHCWGSYKSKPKELLAKAGIR